MSNDLAGFKKLFPQRHISIILNAIIKVGTTINKNSEKEHEDRITERLHNRIIKVSPFRDGPLSIELQVQIPISNPDIDNRPGKIDLKVPSIHGYETYFAIEAKRLRVKYDSRLKTLYGEYVKDGMMRFITGRYAPLMETGAMLGYVFDGQIEIARNGIDNYIQKQPKKLRLTQPQELNRSEILQGEFVYETIHDLTRRQFTIYHIFIAV